MTPVAHRSRLSTILIDAPSGAAAAAAACWSQALGVPARTVNPDEPQYTSLRGARTAGSAVSRL